MGHRKTYISRRKKCRSTNLKIYWKHRRNLEKAGINVEGPKTRIRSSHSTKIKQNIAGNATTSIQISETGNTAKNNSKESNIVNAVPLGASEKTNDGKSSRLTTLRPRVAKRSYTKAEELTTPSEVAITELLKARFGKRNRKNSKNSPSSEDIITNLLNAILDALQHWREEIKCIGKVACINQDCGQVFCSEVEMLFHCVHCIQSYYPSKGMSPTITENEPTVATGNGQTTKNKIVLVSMGGSTQLRQNVDPVKKLQSCSTSANSNCSQRLKPLILATRIKRASSTIGNKENKNSPPEALSNKQAPSTIGSRELPVDEAKKNNSLRETPSVQNKQASSTIGNKALDEAEKSSSPRENIEISWRWGRPKFTYSCNSARRFENVRKRIKSKNQKTSVKVLPLEVGMNLNSSFGSSEGNVLSAIFEPSRTAKLPLDVSRNSFSLVSTQSNGNSFLQQDSLLTHMEPNNALQVENEHPLLDNVSSNWIASDTESSSIAIKQEAYDHIVSGNCDIDEKLVGLQLKSLIEVETDSSLERQEVGSAINVFNEIIDNSKEHLQLKSVIEIETESSHVKQEACNEVGVSHETLRNSISDVSDDSNIQHLKSIIEIEKTSVADIALGPSQDHDSLLLKSKIKIEDDFDSFSGKGCGRFAQSLKLESEVEIEPGKDDYETSDCRMLETKLLL